MSDKERAALGRILMDEQDARKRLAALEQLAYEKARALRQIATLLEKSPENIYAAPDPAAFGADGEPLPRLNSDALSLESLRELAESIREVKNQLWGIEKRKRNAGF